ncbi:MerR family transcriptional regulator [Actinoplanes couchii]|uniref:MerR family transcriptional regulator n=1 Tax=Actinoplanes couchii TaxID=403638 RepID=A0ABQ3XE74_9ACTN|nr:MerR family transcriptional regulator [Actinoplanes couchii]
MIGEVARRTGLSVSAIRFYADEGIVPASGFNSAGHRLYDVTAVARLELIRTLRELGTGLEEIRRLLAGETTLRYLIAEHLELVERQGRELQARRSVLRALNRDLPPVDRSGLMHRLVSMSDQERERLVDDFWAEAGADLPADFAERLGTTRPRLPEDPTGEQLDAWIELADLLKDTDFRAAVRDYLRETHTGFPGASVMTSAPVQDYIHAGQGTMTRILDAYRSGLPAGSDYARELAGRLAAESAAAVGLDDSPERRERLAAAYLMLEEIGDGSDHEPFQATHGRYLELVTRVNAPAPNPYADVDLKGLSGWMATALGR